MALSESLDLLFRRLSVPVLALDAEGRVEACNRAFERLFRYPAAEVTGRDVNEVLTPPEKLEEARRWLDRARLGTEVHHEGECLTRDGKRLDIEVHLLPQSNGNGEVHGFFAILHDVTAKKALTKQLRQAEKMEAIGHLTGGIAHDFNNLLTAIMGYAEMLEIGLDRREGVEPGAKRETSLHRHAREIRRTAERAGELTRRLLAFTRKRDLRPHFLHLNTVILELEGMLRRTLSEKIRVETELDVDVGLVFADRVELEQVILNLVVNARDAMAGAGTLKLETVMRELDKKAVVEFSACQPGSYVCLRVVDDGCGMDEETRRRIFEPFFTTKEEGQGTGLGLASVYGIVSQNDGFVRVESEPGRGTMFEVGLPRARSDATEMPVDASGMIAYGRETILVVEDDEQVREVTRAYLAMSGYHVLVASSEAEALKHLRTHTGVIHLLVTDVVMPDTSGPKLARKLTALRPELKVLYQSGYTDNEVLQQGGPEPGWGYLQKPVRQKVITQKVREILDG